MSIIEVRELTKTFHVPHEKHNTVFESLAGMFRKNEFDTFTALNDINFVVEKGECLGVIGENGSGKSTLLKILANILRPTRGSVKINGTMASFLELGVGFQADLSARENIFVYGTIMGMGRKEIDDNLDDIFEFSGLNEFRDMKLKNFSSGMQVRLAFATAIQTKPDILLMDEVLAVGDMDFQQKCLDVFREYIKEKRTIVFVSHDLGSIRRFCTKSLLLRHGKQVAYGETNEIIDTYVYGIDKTTSVPERNDTITDGDIADKNETRWGNKRIEITDVRFIDKYGKENYSFTTGDQMKVRIYFHASGSVQDLVFGLILYDENDIYCYGTNTTMKKYPINCVKGDNRIDFIIDKIPMYKGKYYLTIAAHSVNGVTYDWHDRLHSFYVYNTSDDLGLFEIPCKWELNEGENNSGK